jgi:ATP-dependent protease ClpP protease subunit
VATVDLNFRADINRSVSVFGEFTDQLVNNISLKILHLRQDDSRPITVFINSNGGTIRCLEFIYGLLSAKGPNGKKPRIITVAVGNAASAAATLLALGDYSIAYSSSSIHFHGSRYGEAQDVTAEYAAMMVEQLSTRNKATASTLARSATERLAFHYARLKDEFVRVRSQGGPSWSGLSDVECFAFCLKEKLSPYGDYIVENALKRWQGLQALSSGTVAKVRASGKKGMAFEVDVFRRVIDYEVRRHKNTDWVLDEDGVMEIANDYLLLRDYDVGHHTELIRNLLARYPDTFITRAELVSTMEKIQGGNESAKGEAIRKLYEQLKPFCYFTTAMWQRLQESENPITPTDAYWLGAVDEVYDSGLPCLREVVESEPAQPNLPDSPKVSTEPAQPS